MNGAFQIARKSFESELWLRKPSAWWKIWVFIIGNVQHKDYGGLKRGQGFFNFRDLTRMECLGEDISYGMIDKFMRYAKWSKMLSTHKSTRGVVISVANYDQYQSFSSYSVDKQVDSPVEMESKWSRNGVDTIYKNVKNDKTPEFAKELVSLLGRDNFRFVDGKSERRMKDGWKVIDHPEAYLRRIKSNKIQSSTNSSDLPDAKTLTNEQLEDFFKDKVIGRTEGIPEDYLFEALDRGVING